MPPGRLSPAVLSPVLYTEFSEVALTNGSAPNEFNHTKEVVMRAITVSEYRSDARLGEHDKPTAGPGQVLVKVEAAG